MTLLTSSSYSGNLVNFRSICQDQLFAENLSNPIRSVVRAIDTHHDMTRYHTETIVLILKVLCCVIDGKVVPIKHPSFLKRTLRQMETDTDTTLYWRLGQTELLKIQRRHLQHLLGLPNERRIRDRAYPFLRAWLQTIELDAENQ